MSNLILLGASTRAAAMSALRAGWTPWCADLFADADLQRIASVHKIAADDYPEALIDVLAEAPDGPVMYTGALENRADLIARIERPLLGNSADVLRAIRSPVQWSACLQAHGVLCPRMSETAVRDGRWLLKPRRSAAGQGIRGYDGTPFNRRSHFLQEHIDGTPVSAVFVCLDGNARLCGVSEQLIGTPWLNANGYQYAGNIGPLTMDAAPWQAIGAALAAEFRLTGLFGVDAVLKDGVPWPVEINPRYTASVELFERACGPALLPAFSWWCTRSASVVGSRRLNEVSSGTKRRQTRTRGASPPPKKIACGFAPASNAGTTPPRVDIVGKAILFARRKFAFPADGPWCDSLLDTNFNQAEYADIPHISEVIEQGRPVLTMFASATSVQECRRALEEKAQALDRCLWG